MFSEPKELISSSYALLNKCLHISRKGFGGSGYRWVGQVAEIIKQYHVYTVLDYGCGQSTLWKVLKKDYPLAVAGVHYREYDPCIPGKDSWPSKADLVTCTDVLEHVEPEYLEGVIAHLAYLANKVVFLNIAQHAANKILPDGRNAHLTIEHRTWWDVKLLKFFPVFPEGDWLWNVLPSPRIKKDYLLSLVRTWSQS